MRNRMLHTVTAVSALVLALTLSGCTAEQTPTSSPTASTPALESVSFSDGATLPPDTEILWGFGFANDPGWVEVGDAPKPGWWTFVRADKTCIAAFRDSALADAGVDAGGDVDDMNDEEATDAVIASELGDEFGDVDGLLSDGYFHRHEAGEAQIAHRQFSLSIDGWGRFVAARAFVALDHSAIVVVTCDGADVNIAAQEVLSKNVIAIEPGPHP